MEIALSWERRPTVGVLTELLTITSPYIPELLTPSVCVPWPARVAGDWTNRPGWVSHQTRQANPLLPALYLSSKVDIHTRTSVDGP